MRALVRFEELLNELGEPGVTDDPAHFQKLMKEQSDLQPIVEAYKEYKKNKETIEDSLSMLESEKDEEMREMLKEELSDAKKRVADENRAAACRPQAISPAGCCLARGRISTISARSRRLHFETGGNILILDRFRYYSNLTF